MKTFLALVVTGALLAGCSEMKTTSADSTDPVKYQVVASGGTEDRVDVINVVSARAGDLVRASVELRNNSNFQYAMEYRFKWYDKGGMEINPEGGSWIPVSLMANETKSLQALAPNPTADTFKLFLQEKP